MNKVLPSGQTARNSIGFKSTANVRRAIALLIAVTSLNLSLWSFPGAFAAPRPAAVATGMMRVAGIVTIDGERANSGQTVFTGSHIATSAGSESIVELGKFTRLHLSEKTEFTLDFSKMNISSWLSKGGLRGFIPAGIPANIRTAGAELLTDSSQPTVFLVQVDGETTKVSVETGRVEVRVGTKLESVAAGQVFATTASSPAPPAMESNLTGRQKVGLFAAIGAAAAILAFAIIGRDETPEEQFGDCVIILSGPPTGFCP